MLGQLCGIYLWSCPWSWPRIFQDQFLKQTYLMYGRADCHGPNEMWVDRLCDTKCDPDFITSPNTLAFNFWILYICTKKTSDIDLVHANNLSFISYILCHTRQWLTLPGDFKNVLFATVFKFGHDCYCGKIKDIGSCVYVRDMNSNSCIPRRCYLSVPPRTILAMHNIG